MTLNPTPAVFISTEFQNLIPQRNDLPTYGDSSGSKILLPATEIIFAQFSTLIQDLLSDLHQCLTVAPLSTVAR